MPELLSANLLSPLPLAFALGVVARVVRSDLTIPKDVYSALGVYLLLALGLHGGAELARTPLATIALPALGTIALGVLTPILAYLVLRRAGRFSVSDAAGIAAHYGSVSAVTFIAAGQYLGRVGTPVESYMPTLLTLLETPGIAVAIAIGAMGLARERAAAPVAHLAVGGGAAAVGGAPAPLFDEDAIARSAARVRWRDTLHEVVTGRTILLLIGGLAIGAAISADAWQSIAPVFDTKSALFKGALVVFLLEMGLLCGERLGDLRKVGGFLLAFGLVMPLAQGALGVLAGTALGLSAGGATMLGVMAGSASYIAAPPAVRMSLPRANPTYSLSLALGITFPFNLLVGIPLLHQLAFLLTRG